MPQNETISLRQTTASNISELEVHDEEQEDIAHDQAGQRQNGSKTKKTCVLIGSGLIQLPIWGKGNMTSMQPSFLHRS